MTELDRGKALPLTQSCECSTNPRVHPTPPTRHCSRCECYVGIAQDQRDADLIILERDYVARERVKPLVEFLESFRRNQALLDRQGYSLALEALKVKAEEVLKALNVGVSDGKHNR